MKKLMILFLLWAVPAASEGVIASYNILHLGWKGKDYKRNAYIINKFDITGLVEVMNECGLKKLVKALEASTMYKWKYHISDKKVGKKGSRYKEYYAYVWKADKVQLIESLGFYKEKHDTDFIREPYGAIFKINKFDFTFVLCHLIWGKSITDRRSEAELLPKVYEYFMSINAFEKDIIIAGDFNLNAEDKAFKYFVENTSIKYTVIPDQDTTIGKSGLVSSYDNMFYNSKYTDEILNGYVYILNGIKDFKIYRKTVSDHLPIYCIVNIYTDDD